MVRFRLVEEIDGCLLIKASSVLPIVYRVTDALYSSLSMAFYAAHASMCIKATPSPLCHNVPKHPTP